MDNKERFKNNPALLKALEGYSIEQSQGNNSEKEDDQNTPTFFQYLFNNGTNTSVASVVIVIANIINPILIFCSESDFFIFATVIGWYLIAPFWLFAGVSDYKSEYQTQKAQVEKNKGVLVCVAYCFILLVITVILICITPQDSTSTYSTTHSSTKCDSCGKSNARSYTSTNSAGVVIHYNLCSDCYSKVKKAADAYSKIA